jgi:hypothetical protein
MCWIPGRKKSFEVKSYYKVLLSPIQSSFSRKSIWKVKAYQKKEKRKKVKVSPRVAFFVWTMSLGKIQTLDNFMKEKHYCDGVVLYV